VDGQSLPTLGPATVQVNATLLSRSFAPVTGLKFSRDGQFLASADVDRTVRVWQGGHLTFEKNFRSDRERLRAIDIVRGFEISPGGKSIFIAAGDSVTEIPFAMPVPLWRRGRKPTFGFIITCPKALAVAKSGEIAMAYDDAYMEVLPIGYPGRAVRQWKDNDAPFCMSYLSDGRTLIGTDGRSICMWNAQSGEKTWKFSLGTKVCNVVASETEPIAAIRTLHRVFLLDCKSLQIISSAPTLHGSPTLAMSTDGQYVAAGDMTGVSVFDQKGSLVDRFPQISARTLAIAFLPGARTLAIGSSDGTVVLWMFTPGQKLLPASVY
jgi:WD40 repeat protein